MAKSGYDERQMKVRHDAIVQGFFLILALMGVEIFLQTDLISLGERELFQGIAGNLVILTASLTLVFFKMNLQGAINYEEKGNFIFPGLLAILGITQLINISVEIHEAQFMITPGYVISSDLGALLCAVCWMSIAVVSFATAYRQLHRAYD